MRGLVLVRMVCQFMLLSWFDDWWCVDDWLVLGIDDWVGLMNDNVDDRCGV